MIIWIIVAFSVGTIFGAVITALCVAAGKADERMGLDEAQSK